jgi:hypothetical protein
MWLFKGERSATWVKDRRTNAMGVPAGSALNASASMALVVSLAQQEPLFLISTDLNIPSGELLKP